MSKIQAILFDRNWWTIPRAQAWLREHQYEPIKELHETNHWIRARLLDPVGIMRIITLSPKDRIRAVIMFTNGRAQQGGRLRRPSKGSVQLPVRRRGAGWGYLDAHPNLLGDIATTALAGLAIAGIVTAAKKASK